MKKEKKKAYIQLGFNVDGECDKMVIKKSKPSTMETQDNERFKSCLEKEDCESIKHLRTFQYSPEILLKEYSVLCPAQLEKLCNLLNLCAEESCFSKLKEAYSQLNISLSDNYYPKETVAFYMGVILIPHSMVDNVDIPNVLDFATKMHSFDNKYILQVNFGESVTIELKLLDFRSSLCRRLVIVK